MGGQTGIGGKEVVVVMMKKPGAETSRRVYKLLATSRTSTMQKELQQAGDEGFDSEIVVPDVGGHVAGRWNLFSLRVASGFVRRG
jgi:hypothetical protein